MKRLALKIISTIICLSTLMNVPVVFGAYSDIDENSKYYDAVALFEELGIVTGLEEELFRPEVAMTRADFALAFAGVLNNDGSEISQQQFNDVPSSNSAFSAVNYMSLNGYIKGDGDGNYRPNDGMTLNEGLIVATRVLGYEALGTDIMNSLVQDVKNDLSKGITIGINEYLTRGDMCILLYNTLNAPMVVIGSTVGNRVEYEINKDTTILSKNMEVQKKTGIFLADNNCAIYGLPTERKGDVVISYETYTYDGDSSGLVGKQVDFYSDEDGNIIAVFDKSEDSITVMYNDIKPQSDEYNFVYEDNRKTVTARISKNAYYAYNGMHAKTINADLVKPEYGEVILTDFDGDRQYDSVIVWEYKADTIRSVISSQEKIILDETGKTLTSDMEIRIYKDGAEADISSLSPFDFALVAEADGLVTLHASSNKVTGTCTEISTTDNYAVINSVQYGIIPGLANSIIPGKDITAFIDKYGNIGSVEDVSKIKYGFVQKAFYKDGSNEKVVLRIFAQDSQLHDYEAADKISVKNGSSSMAMVNNETLRNYFYNGTEFKEQLVRYEINDKEEVVKLYLPENSDLDDYGNESFVCNMNTAEMKNEGTLSSEVSKFYNNYFYVEEKKTELSFLTDTSTTVFYLPEKEKDWAVMTPSGLGSGSTYPSLWAYDMSEDGVVGCVVIKATGAIATGFSRSNTMFVVDDIVNVVNEENEPGVKLSGFSSAAKAVSFFASEPETIISGANENGTLYYQAKLSDVKRGDVIQVKLDADGAIHDFRIMYSYGEEDIAVSPFPDTEGANIRVLDREKSSFAFYGDVIEKGKKAIVVYNSLMPKKRSYTLGNCKTVIYDTITNRASAATTEDIYAGAKAFVYMFPAYGDAFVLIYQ